MNPARDPTRTKALRRPRRAGFAALLGAVLWAATAAAAPSKQDVARADKLFRDARTLMQKGDHATACPMLEESQKLDPAPGTRYQLAVCYENTGRPATALAFYLEVADLAKAAKFKDKEKAARDKATALEPRVPRLVIEVAPASRVSGLAITRDGEPVEEGQWNQPVLVDGGEYAIEASAPGKQPFKTTVAVKGEGAKVTVPIALRDVEAPPPPPPPPKPSGFGAQRYASIGVAAVGLGSVVAGSVFGLNAKSAYETAMGDTSLCPTKTTCYPDGKALVDQARTDATISTALFVAGGVAVAGAVVLFVTAPSTKPAPTSGQTRAHLTAVLPVAGEGFAGLAAAGTF